MIGSSPPAGHPVDERAERILAAALIEFADRGFPGARLATIARRAGVSAATIRLYFPLKEALFREAVRSAIVGSVVAEQGEDDETIEHQASADRVRRFARRFWRSMESPDVVALRRLANVELPRFPELALLHATELVARPAVALERILVDGVRRGELAITDPRGAARVVVAALLTYALWLERPDIYSDIVPLERGPAEAAALEVLIAGLCPARVSASGPAP